MKLLRALSLFIGLVFASAAFSKVPDGSHWTKNTIFQNKLYSELGISFKEISVLKSSPEVVGFLSRQAIVDDSSDKKGILKDPIADYETYLPHKTKPKLPVFERSLLTAYLDHPDSGALTKLLAIYHLDKSLLQHGKKSGKALKHTIIARYFLSRTKDLGSNEHWVTTALKKVDGRLAALENLYPQVSSEENHDAHSFFNDTFNYHEENRYKAAEKLLDDYFRYPNNVYSAFLNNALNLWVGGEADYADPTTLYNFVLGSHFSLRAMNLSRQLEETWKVDPEHTKLFRMSTIIGGFSVLQRRWLAELHHDQQAIDLLDDEHQKWFVIHRPFHMFTVGLAHFEKDFPKGLQAMDEGFNECFQVFSELRTCVDDPRFSFNSEGIFLSYIDFILKKGDLATANGLLEFLGQAQPPFTMNLPYWDLGAGPLQHRKEHLSEIHALYQNDDPNDDPINFLMKKRKWSSDTSTCQTCHQAQSKIWTEQEKKTVRLPPKEYATVDNWPEVSTTWYGASR